MKQLLPSFKVILVGGNTLLGTDVPDLKTHGVVVFRDGLNQLDRNITPNDREPRPFRANFNLGNKKNSVGGSLEDRDTTPLLVRNCCTRKTVWPGINVKQGPVAFLSVLGQNTFDPLQQTFGISRYIVVFSLLPSRRNSLWMRSLKSKNTTIPG